MNISVGKMHRKKETYGILPNQGRYGLVFNLSHPSHLSRISSFSDDAIVDVAEK